MTSVVAPGNGAATAILRLGTNAADPENDTALADVRALDALVADLDVATMRATVHDMALIMVGTIEVLREHGFDVDGLLAQWGLTLALVGSLGGGPHPENS